ncbi:KN motif and ankyrin repeat domain-containing protein 4 [Polyodon spathula]|uniref:KN motif and ankyrin repeat domain-containing protein 4 n=1 Tax=Polyodon spathula TaxID=7913 RepID=UPI001B7DA33C|nr:KN motif and ankyrin repeat domain-containing protein 4 [Polyodon spathula]XP_041126851.1 KN motif and ankyrin repeat domain-containing protein 4 [Polyodon spathula]XP_041126852.1 KN motif and ankyrin repeat domain-containing protein 4 [Polyodon spathula]XP_041126853.1 KN motif and ankyrin repeat domain-containing protein 4 [Polyodon spathula]
MDKKTATGLSSKPSERGDQRKQLPYSVETPYGFHLDLDFLKYVDDIEKGNTLRRVHIQRRAKAPKFCTLPRNFSLPDNSSRSFPRESWTSTCSLVPRSTSRDVEFQQNFEFRAADHVSAGVSSIASGVTSRSERAASGDARTRAFDEQPLGFRVRPQLLRASSMPVTVLQRKNSENSEDQTEPLPRHGPRDNGSSENVFCSNDDSSAQDTAKNCEAVLTSEVSNLRQQLAAALQMIKVLEEEVKTIPELTEQVSTLTEEKDNLILQLNCQLAVSVQGLPQTTACENTEQDKHSLHSLISNNTAEKQIASSTDVLASATSLTTKASEAHSHSQQQKIRTAHRERAGTPTGSSLQDVAVCVAEGAAGLAAQKTNSDTEALTSIALRTKLTVLEKQLSDTTKELEKANTLLKQQVEENKMKALMLEQQSEQDNSNPQLEGAEMGEQTEEVEKSKQSNCVRRCNASVNTETSSEVKMFSDKGTTTDMQIPTRSAECGAGANIIETPKKDLRSSSVQTESLEVRSAGVVASVQTGEKSINATVSACDKAIETDQPLIQKLVTCKPVEKDEQVADLEKESECMKQCVSSRESDFVSVVDDCKSKEGCIREVTQDCKKECKGDREEPTPSSSTQAAIGHYVTKIQQLLHEQWAVLENSYPELASTLKQPASKISSIQDQLVSSLNTLSSMYSSKAEKEATNASSAQQAGSSPAAALKSIMKKKDCSVSTGKSAAKKNLKFVGINGGYETTSSEESSGEDSGQDGSSGTEDGGSGPGDRASERSAAGGMEASDLSCLGDSQAEEADRETIQENFLAACHYLKDHLTETAFPNKEMRQCLRVVYQEWFRVSSQKASSADTVAGYLRELRAMTPELVAFIVNLADGNGNTALHYSVSHSNFHIVKLLLGTGGCKVDHQNKAGYTAIMLASLTATESQEEMEVALQLLRQGDINTRASQAGQTALMLAVSHGRTDMVRSLLACDADVNIQDDDGATALMCACEHGHAEIVQLLLAQPGCRAQLTDNDGNTALSIALEASLSEIAALLYTHAGQRDSPAP